MSSNTFCQWEVCHPVEAMETQFCSQLQPLSRHFDKLYLSGCGQSKGAGVAILADDGKYFILRRPFRHTLCSQLKTTSRHFVTEEQGCISIWTYTEQKEQLVQREVCPLWVATETCLMFTAVDNLQTPWHRGTGAYF